MKREVVEKIQFNGLYQLSSESLCSSCVAATVKTSMYMVIEMIGKGSFGRVYHVKEKISGEGQIMIISQLCFFRYDANVLFTGKDFAMKVMEKEEVLKTSEPRHLAEERRILASINFPFTVSYESHFQTRSELCLVMEYVEGSDLYQLLTSEGTFDLEAVRFYLSEILLSLEYLHHLGLIYRDLKLENILVDKTGHVKIVDLGFTRVLGKGEKCRTFCGTVHYLAPEILQGKKYNKAVDWWAFGILAYEVSLLSIEIPP